jgi:hypothetical protein
MSLRSIRRRCEAALVDVPVPHPFDINDFCQLVSHRRRRALHLLPKRTRLGPCGVWLALAESDYVFYEPETSQLHREHIILHELGHLLCAHQPSEVIDDRVLLELLPNLDPAVVRRVLGRTTYTAVEEQEAEMVASIVRERVEREDRVASTHTHSRVDASLGSDAAAVDRLRATL